jgi:hypothetical protein
LLLLAVEEAVKVSLALLRAQAEVQVVIAQVSARLAVVVQRSLLLL